MHARLTKFEGSPQQIEAGIKSWLVDRASGKGFSVTFFESESALRASEDAVAKIRANVAQASGAKITGVENYEVVAEARVEDLTPAR